MSESFINQESIEGEADNNSLIKYYGLSNKRKKSNTGPITDFMVILEESRIAKCMKCSNNLV